MPDLVKLLNAQDLGHLRIVADLWGLDLKLTDAHSGLETLAAAMLEPRLATEIMESLEPGARAAVNALVQSAGRMPWVVFVRQFGDVREMGAGRRDREQPHLHPASPAEVLFYRALLGRAFLDTDQGAQEFAYIPDDLLGLLQRPTRGAAVPRETLGRAAAAAERRLVFPATDRILDDATSLLAAMRMDLPLPEDTVLKALLETAGILRQGIPQAARVKSFLEMPRAQALKMLADAWRTSETFNELRLVPSLVCEGAWANRPRAARQFLLSQLEAIPPGSWWSLPAFIAAIKQRHADFQRPAGDYDSWFIKRAADGSYLRGFESWDQAEGALIQFTISAVMFRLALLDIASASEGGQTSALRRLGPRDAHPSAPENGKLHITSQGRISASPQVPRAIRYQLARFCEWDEAKADEHRYHASPRSLGKAKQQGLRVEHLLGLLAKNSDAGIPPALVRALKRWEANGTEARAETQVVLRVGKPQILEELRKSKAAKYLGEPLGPTAVIVKGGAMHKVAEAMTELGLLLEERTTSPG